MKLALTLAALLVAASSLTACMAEKPAQYPPSMMLERDTMPDNTGDEKSEN
jgi:predicted small lipoprotein YifL